MPAEPPLRITVEGTNALWDNLASLGLVRFVTGAEPFAETLKLSAVARAADLVPLGSVRWRLKEPDSSVLWPGVTPGQCSCAAGGTVTPTLT